MIQSTIGLTIPQRKPSLPNSSLVLVSSSSLSPPSFEHDELDNVDNDDYDYIHSNDIQPSRNSNDDTRQEKTQEDNDKYQTTNKKRETAGAKSVKIRLISRWNSDGSIDCDNDQDQQQRRKEKESSSSTMKSIHHSLEKPERRPSRATMVMNNMLMDSNDLFNIFIDDNNDDDDDSYTCFCARCNEKKNKKPLKSALRNSNHGGRRRTRERRGNRVRGPAATTVNVRRQQQKAITAIAA